VSYNYAGYHCLLSERSNKNDSYHESRPVRGNPSRRLRGGAGVVRTATGLPAHILSKRHRGRAGACGASVCVHCAAAGARWPRHAHDFRRRPRCTRRADSRSGTRPCGAGNLLERRAQDYVPRSRRKRDRVRRRSAVTGFRSRRRQEVAAYLPRYYELAFYLGAALVLPVGQVL
jgi:hypothetical protein